MFLFSFEIVSLFHQILQQNDFDTIVLHFLDEIISSVCISQISEIELVQRHNEYRISREFYNAGY